MCPTRGGLATKKFRLPTTFTVPLAIFQQIIFGYFPSSGIHRIEIVFSSKQNLHKRKSWLTFFWKWLCVVEILQRVKTTRLVCVYCEACRVILADAILTPFPYYPFSYPLSTLSHFFFLFRVTTFLKSTNANNRNLSFIFWWYRTNRSLFCNSNQFLIAKKGQRSRQRCCLDPFCSIETLNSSIVFQNL